MTHIFHHVATPLKLKQRLDKILIAFLNTYFYCIIIIVANGSHEQSWTTSVRNSRAAQKQSHQRQRQEFSQG